MSAELSLLNSFGREALRVTRLIFYYDAQHDLRLWDHVLPGVTYISPINQEEFIGIAAYRDAIKEDFELWFDIYEEKYRLDHATENAAVVTGSYILQDREEENFFFMARQRFTALLVKADGRPMLKHLHISDPDYTLRSDSRKLADGSFGFNVSNELSSFVSRLRIAATHDRMTGLYNRNYLDSDYDALNAISLKGRGFVLYFDLNGFKQVNDRFGHDVGDEVLKGFASALKDSVSAVLQGTCLIRMGGDEFLCLHNNGTREDAARIVRELKAECARHWSQYAAYVSFSAGMARARPQMTLNELISVSERRMRRCKRRLSVSRGVPYAGR